MDVIEQLIAEVPRSAAGWLLECPRSPTWWHNATVREGSTLRGQYQRGVSSSGISQTDRSTREHAVLSEVLEKAMCIDQLDVMNLCALELCIRRLHLIAEGHRVKPTQPNYQGSECWMGARARRWIRVAPLLSRFVAEEQRQDSTIQLEKRKAAENGAAGAKMPPPRK